MTSSTSSNNSPSPDKQDLRPTVFHDAPEMDIMQISPTITRRERLSRYQARTHAFNGYGGTPLVQTIGQYDQYEDEFFQSLIETAQEMVERNQIYLASLIAEREKRIQAQLKGRHYKSNKRSQWKRLFILIALTSLFFVATQYSEVSHFVLDALTASTASTTSTKSTTNPPVTEDTKTTTGASAPSMEQHKQHIENQYRRFLNHAG